MIEKKNEVVLNVCESIGDIQDLLFTGSLKNMNVGEVNDEISLFTILAM